MNKQEFESGYADRSGVTLDQLYQFGGHAEVCDCGEEDCRGWRMVFSEPTASLQGALGIVSDVAERCGLTRAEVIEVLNSVAFNAPGLGSCRCEVGTRGTTTEQIRLCGICKNETKQTVYNSGHERDSSGDHQECHECGGIWSGTTGKWRKAVFPKIPVDVPMPAVKPPKAATENPDAGRQQSEPLVGRVSDEVRRDNEQNHTG